MCFSSSYWCLSVSSLMDLSKLVFLYLRLLHFFRLLRLRYRLLLILFHQQTSSRGILLRFRFLYGVLLFPLRIKFLLLLLSEANLLDRLFPPFPLQLIRRRKRPPVLSHISVRGLLLAAWLGLFQLK